jgi:hypothetical protein
MECTTPMFLIMSKNNPSHPVYGVALFMHGEIVDFIEDVTCSKAAAVELVAKCNALEVAAEHFRDVVSDWVAEQTDFTARAMKSYQDV